MPFVNVSVFSPIARQNILEVNEVSTFDKEMILTFTATESTTSFYLTKGWSAAAITAQQEVTLDYLYIQEQASQQMEINCGVLAEVTNYLLFNGINMSDSVIAKTYLNHYFKRNLSYAAYQSVNQLCQTNQGSFVLMQPGVEYEEVRGYRFGFNTQEKDDEIFNGAYTAEFWEYDSRLGRRWNLDPVPQVTMSDYSVLGNCPLLYIDILGDSKESRHLDPDGKIIAEYDDGDNSVYQHQTARTKTEVDFWRAKFKNTSGNGKKIGEMSIVGIGVFNISTFLQKPQIALWSTSALGFNRVQSSQANQPSRAVANDGMYGLPLDGEMRLTDTWGDLEDRLHNGLDIVYPIPGQVNGAKIYAPVGGTIVQLVTTESDGQGGGVRIRIRDKNGNEHALYHMQTRSNSHLKGRTTVKLGEVVGRVGNTGGSKGPHLHYEIWRNGKRSDRPNPANINPFLKNIPLR